MKKGDETSPVRETVAVEAEQYHLIVDALEDYAIFLLDSQGRITRWNQGAERIFGYTKVEAQGRKYGELFPPEAQAEGLPERELATAREVGRLKNEHWFARKEGTTFFGQRVLLALPDREESSPGGFAGLLRDRTDRLEREKEVEAALRASEERFRLLVEGAKEYAMFLLDTQGRITFWSAGAQRLFGWTDTEVLGESGELIFTPEDRAAHKPDEEIFTAQTTGKATDRRWHLRKDGSRFWADGLLMRLDDEDGRMRGFAKIARDATEQKRAEDALHSSAEAVAQLNDELEGRVTERTAQLAASNRQLQDEIIERQQSEIARRDLMRRLARAQEEERRRLSRELHDQMGQYLTAFALGLKALEDSQPPDAASRASLVHLREIAHEMGQEIHRLAVQLRPTALDDLGLQTALRGYIDEWMERTGILVDYDVSGLAANERLSLELETPLYRIVQEALNNVVRHSGASKVSVLLSRQKEQIVLIVEDNGKGFSVEHELASHASSYGKRGRLGLLGMQERVQLIGGVFTVESRPGQGTTLFIRIPVA